jgi:hypothetical protein
MYNLNYVALTMAVYPQVLYSLEHTTSELDHLRSLNRDFTGSW